MYIKIRFIYQIAWFKTATYVAAMQRIDTFIDFGLFTSVIIVIIRLQSVNKQKPICIDFVL